MVCVDNCSEVFWGGTCIDLLVAILGSVLPGHWKTHCGCFCIWIPSARGAQRTLDSADYWEGGREAGREGGRLSFCEGTAAKGPKLHVQRGPAFPLISVLSLALHWGSPNTARCSPCTPARIRRSRPRTVPSPCPASGPLAGSSEPRLFSSPTVGLRAHPLPGVA